MRRILIVGSNGSGKVMKARTLASELRIHAPEEKSIKEIYLNSKMKFSGTAPFRAPHHTVSELGLCGKRHSDMRSELALSYCGTLLLDELIEFRKSVLELLAERLNQFPEIPKLLIATANNCPCGKMKRDDTDKCICTKSQLMYYNNRLLQYCGLLGFNEIINADSK